MLRNVWVVFVRRLIDLKTLASLKLISWDPEGSCCFTDNHSCCVQQCRPWTFWSFELFSLLIHLPVISLINSLWNVRKKKLFNGCLIGSSVQSKSANSHSEEKKTEIRSYLAFLDDFLLTNQSIALLANCLLKHLQASSHTLKYITA